MKLTYLLGAGASARALPTVKGDKSNPLDGGLATAYREIAYELQNQGGGDIKNEHNEFKASLVENLIWLSDCSIKFGTTDTYAKFLYLQSHNNPELTRLKETLITFFLIEQLVRKKVDPRPMIFLTTIMDEGIMFPNQVKILNWNYDFQMQLAARSFGSPSLIKYYPWEGNSDFVKEGYEAENIQMVHMNGIAGYYLNFKHGSNQLHYFEQPIRDFSDLFVLLKKDISEKHNLLTFAWETDTDANNILKERIEYAKALVRGTEILVVIGFPFFNRVFDKAIFEAIKETPSLQKIYFQDPNRNGQFLKNQFGLRQSLDIEPVPDVDNYFVPLEL